MSQLQSVFVPPVPSVAALPPPNSGKEVKQKLKLPLEEMETSEIAPEQAASQGSSPTSPLLPLPDVLLTALNMGAQRRAQSNGAGVNQGGMVRSEELILGPGAKEILLEKFKEGSLQG